MPCCCPLLCCSPALCSSCVSRPASLAEDWQLFSLCPDAGLPGPHRPPPAHSLRVPMQCQPLGIAALLLLLTAIVGGEENASAPTAISHAAVEVWSAQPSRVTCCSICTRLRPRFSVRCAVSDHHKAGSSTGNGNPCQNSEPPVSHVFQIRSSKACQCFTEIGKTESTPGFPGSCRSSS